MSYTRRYPSKRSNPSPSSSVLWIMPTRMWLGLQWARSGSHNDVIRGFVLTARPRSSTTVNWPRSCRTWFGLLILESCKSSSINLVYTVLNLLIGRSCIIMFLRFIQFWHSSSKIPAVIFGRSDRCWLSLSLSRPFLVCRESLVPNTAGSCYHAPNVRWILQKRENKKAQNRPTSIPSMW